MLLLSRKRLDPGWGGEEDRLLVTFYNCHALEKLKLHTTNEFELKYSTARLQGSPLYMHFPFFFNIHVIRGMRKTRCNVLIIETTLCQSSTSSGFTVKLYILLISFRHGN